MTDDEEKTVPPIGPADVDLHQVAAEFAATLPPIKCDEAVVVSMTELWRKCSLITRIQNDGIRRREVIGLSEQEVFSLACFIRDGFSVVTAAANWMMATVERGRHADGEENYQRRTYELQHVTYVIMAPEQQAIIRRHAS